jgi:hypothetical protein
VIRLFPRLEVSTTGPISVSKSATSYTAGLYAVESLHVTWGRGALTDASATPATVGLTVLDRSPARALAARQDLIGRLVRITYTQDPSGLENPLGSLFYGRITSARSAPAGRDPKVDGWLVTISASSLEVDLANVKPRTVWPAETFGARYNRMVAAMPSAWTTPPTIPDRFAVGLPAPADPTVDTLLAWPCAQLDTSSSDLLSLWSQFYASLSHFPMGFDPATGTLTFASMPRDVYSSQIGGTFTAGLAKTPDSGGLYRVCRGGSNGLGLDAGRMPYDRSSGLEQLLEQQLTRLEVQYLDSANGYQTATYGKPVGRFTQEATIGRRTWSVSSVHASRDGAVSLAALYERLIDGELRLPRLDKLTLSSKSEPFQSLAHARFVLQTTQTGAGAYANGSWLPLLGQRAMLMLLGGTVTYTGGEWTVAAQPSLIPRISPPEGSSYAPLRVRDVDPARTVRVRDIDRAVRFADLRFIDLAAGASEGTPYPGNAYT